jgi:GTP cyclohydrolase II
MTGRRAALLGLGGNTAGVVRVALSGAPAAQSLRDLVDPLSKPGVAPTVVAVTAARPTDGDSAAVALAKIARLLPAAVTAAAGLVNERAVEEWARLEGLLIVDAGAILNYPVETARRLAKVGEARVPLAGAENTRIVAFRPTDGGLEHLAIIVGQPEAGAPLLARIHSECFTGDLLGSLRCDCGDQLRGAIREIAEQGAGVLLYLAQEGRGIGLVNKLRAYQLQDEGFDTVDANLQLGFDADERVYVPAAEMLRQLGYGSVRLMTNNPLKVEALRHCGVEVVERVAHIFPSNDHNVEYLRTKAVKSGHML